MTNTSHTSKKATGGINRKQEALLEIVELLHAEIASYRSVENTKAGHDIGWERAAEEWMQTHFLEWKRRHWQLAVEQALRTPEITTKMAFPSKRTPADTATVAKTGIFAPSALGQASCGHLSAGRTENKKQNPE